MNKHVRGNHNSSKVSREYLIDAVWYLKLRTPRKFNAFLIQIVSLVTGHYTFSLHKFSKVVTKFFKDSYVFDTFSSKCSQTTGCFRYRESKIEKK